MLPATATPVFAAVEKASAKTPSGIRSRSQPTSTVAVSATASKTRTSKALRSGAMRVIAAAKRITPARSARMFSSAAARKRFVGISVVTHCASVGVWPARSVASRPAVETDWSAARASASTASPSNRRGATASVSAPASRRKTRKASSDIPPRRPAVRVRGVEPTASTRHETIKGTATIRSAFVHRTPAGSKADASASSQPVFVSCASAPSAKPAARPASDPAVTTAGRVRLCRKPCMLSEGQAQTFGAGEKRPGAARAFDEPARRLRQLGVEPPAPDEFVELVDVRAQVRQGVDALGQRRRAVEDGEVRERAELREQQHRHEALPAARAVAARRAVLPTDSQVLARQRLAREEAELLLAPGPLAIVRNLHTLRRPEVISQRTRPPRARVNILIGRGDDKAARAPEQKMSQRGQRAAVRPLPEAGAARRRVLAEVRADHDGPRADARRRRAQRLFERVHARGVPQREVEAMRGDEQPRRVAAVKESVEGVNAAAEAERGLTRRRLAALAAPRRARLRVSRGPREQHRISPPLAPDFQQATDVRQPRRADRRVEREASPALECGQQERRSERLGRGEQFGLV